MFTNLQVLTDILAVGYPLDLCRGGQIHGLAQVGEAECPGYSHVGERQVVYIQKRSEPRQTGGRREKGEHTLD